MEAILALADRVTADSPRDAPAPQPLALHFPGGVIGLQSTVSVGADATNQVVLEDRYVSRFHCRLLPHGGRWLLEDLSSTNGTFLDGARIAEADVEAGARIRVGSAELRIEQAGPRLQATLPGLVARDPALAPVLELLRRAAPSSLPVTILGESGTGKEVAARAVHELSDRSCGPFVPLNCGAISRELAEAELFGHEKGAFTGAVTSAPGAFGAADGGTLFLDEIADLPSRLQVALLRALEAGEVKPVGAAKRRRIRGRRACANRAQRLRPNPLSSCAGAPSTSWRSWPSAPPWRAMAETAGPSPRSWASPAPACCASWIRSACGDDHSVPRYVYPRIACS